MDRRRHRLVFGLAFLVSLGGHVVALRLYDPRVAAASLRPEVIELVQLPAKYLATLPQLSPPDASDTAPPPETVEEKKKREEEERQRQVVDLMVKDPNQPKPEKADFLSEFNNRTEQESWRPGEGGENGMMQMPDQPPAPAVIIPEVKPEDKEGRRQEEERRQSRPKREPRQQAPRPQVRHGRLAEASPEAATVPAGQPQPSSPLVIARGKAITREDLMLSPSELQAGNGSENREKTEGQGGGDNRPRQPARVIPGNMAPGRTGSIEDLRRVKMGDLTVLNSYAEKHAGFFNQMKRLIFFHWKDYVYKAYLIAYGSGDNPPIDSDYLGTGSTDLVTVVDFTINGQGKVLNKDVARPCGVLRADDFALQAIRLAAPFPNVPEELLDENGEYVVKFSFAIGRQ